ncbi:unnamed protein product [Caretta caretta]
MDAWVPWVACSRTPGFRGERGSRTPGFLGLRSPHGERGTRTPGFLGLRAPRGERGSRTPGLRAPRERGCLSLDRCLALLRAVIAVGGQAGGVVSRLVNSATQFPRL